MNSKENSGDARALEFTIGEQVFVMLGDGGELFGVVTQLVPDGELPGYRVRINGALELLVVAGSVRAARMVGGDRGKADDALAGQDLFAGARAV